MGTLMNDIWPHLLTALVSAIGMYIGMVHKIRIKVAVLEQKVESLQKRVDSHGKKTDDILETINDFKQEISKQLSDISVDIAKLATKFSIFDKENV